MAFWFGFLDPGKRKLAQKRNGSNANNVPKAFGGGKLSHEIPP